MPQDGAKAGAGKRDATETEEKKDGEVDMKISAHEYDGSFSISMTADTVEEAAFLVRMGMNRTNAISYCESSANKDGTFTGIMSVKKRARSNSVIPRSK